MDSIHPTCGGIHITDYKRFETFINDLLNDTFTYTL